jgi:hypothetical protein
VWLVGKLAVDEAGRTGLASDASAFVAAIRARLTSELARPPIAELRGHSGTLAHSALVCPGSLLAAEENDFTGG